MRDRDSISKPVHSFWVPCAGMRPKAGFSEGLIPLGIHLSTHTVVFISSEECSSYNDLIASEWAQKSLSLRQLLV